MCEKPYTTAPPAMAPSRDMAINTLTQIDESLSVFDLNEQVAMWNEIRLMLANRFETQINSNEEAAKMILEKAARLGEGLKSLRAY